VGKATGGSVSFDPLDGQRATLLIALIGGLAVGALIGAAVSNAHAGPSYSYGYGYAAPSYGYQLHPYGERPRALGPFLR
jgi:hypothetical protein